MALTDGPKLGVLVDGDQGELHYSALMKRWRALDSLIQASSISASVASPPGSPSDGDTYIVASGASGAWSGHVGKLARWSAKLSAWEFIVPKAGWWLWNEATSDFLFYSGSTWASWRGTLGIPTGLLAINAQTGTSYTLALSDSGKLVTCQNSSAVTIGLPANASVAFEIGSQILIAQIGSGQVTVDPDVGVTLISPETYSLRKQGAQAVLVKTATNTWLLEGNLEAA